MSEQAASAGDWLSQGRELLRRRKFDEAAKCFVQALEQNPHDTAAHEAMATAAFVVKDYEKAAHHFREASRCDASRALRPPKRRCRGSIRWKRDSGF